MKRLVQQRRVALLLCLALTTGMILSAALMLHHAGHQCTGAGCGVCDQLRHASTFFQPLSLLTAGCLSVAALIFQSFSALREAEAPARASSLVWLKVRLNH